MPTIFSPVTWIKFLHQCTLLYQLHNCLAVDNCCYIVWISRGVNSNNFSTHCSLCCTKYSLYEGLLNCDVIYLSIFPVITVGLLDPLIQFFKGDKLIWFWMYICNLYQEMFSSTYCTHLLFFHYTIFVLPKTHMTDHSHAESNNHSHLTDWNSFYITAWMKGMRLNWKKKPAKSYNYIQL